MLAALEPAGAEALDDRGVHIEDLLDSVYGRDFANSLVSTIRSRGPAEGESVLLRFEGAGEPSASEEDAGASISPPDDQQATSTGSGSEMTARERAEELHRPARDEPTEINSEALGEVIELLTHDDLVVRRPATIAIELVARESVREEIREPETVRRLVYLLDDNNGDVRAAAANTLLQVAEIQPMLLEDRSVEVIDLLADGDWRVRQAGCKLVGTLEIHGRADARQHGSRGGPPRPRSRDGRPRASFDGVGTSGGP